MVEKFLFHVSRLSRSARMLPHSLEPNGELISVFQCRQRLQHLNRRGPIEHRTILVNFSVTEHQAAFGDFLARHLRKTGLSFEPDYHTLRLYTFGKQIQNPYRTTDDLKNFSTWLNSYLIRKPTRLQLVTFRMCEGAFLLTLRAAQWVRCREFRCHFSLHPGQSALRYRSRTRPPCRGTRVSRL